MNIRGLRHHSFDSWRAHRVQKLCSHMWCCLWCDHGEVRIASAVTCGVHSWLEGPPRAVASPT